MSYISHGGSRGSDVLQLINYGVTSNASRLKVGIMEITICRLIRLYSESFFDVEPEFLISLHLRRNAIESIELQTFSRFANLLHLDLSNNHIKVLEPGVFDSLRVVLSFRIARNKLSIINTTVFNSMINLYLFNAEENAIVDIFVNFSTINPNAVFLGNNRIGTIRRGTFRDCSHRLILDLFHNQIEDIEISAFQNVQFNVLLLAGNRLSDEGDIQENVEDVTFLDVSCNAFTRLPKTERNR